MRKFWRVHCPICNAEAEYSEMKGPQANCRHFARYDRGDRIVYFSDDLGEEVPVHLEDIAEGCYSFSCPLCREDIEACASLQTGRYHVSTKCRHFTGINKTENETLVAEFQDDLGEIHVVDLELI